MYEQFKRRVSAVLAAATILGGFLALSAPVLAQSDERMASEPGMASEQCSGPEWTTQTTCTLREHEVRVNVAPFQPFGSAQAEVHVTVAANIPLRVAIDEDKNYRNEDHSRYRSQIVEVGTYPSGEWFKSTEIFKLPLAMARRKGHFHFHWIVRAKP